MHVTQAKTLLTRWNGMNLYRGCTHGCVYCDSRSVCYGFTHEFEDIEVKENAPALLEQALRSRKKPCMISTGSMSDPYMPLERELKLTRRCLSLIDQYGFGATVITKSDLVLRDLDLLTSINQKAKAVVQMTLTTMDEDLCRILEPRAPTTRRRFEALKTLRDSGIPTVVWLCPILPYINDTTENIEGLLDCCAEAQVRGIVCFGMGMTLRDGDREYYYAALDKYFPGLSDRYRREFGLSYQVVSPRNGELMALFRRRCSELGILQTPEDCFAYLRELPEKFEQLSLY